MITFPTWKMTLFYQTKTIWCTETLLYILHKAKPIRNNDSNMTLKECNISAKCEYIRTYSNQKFNAGAAWLQGTVRLRITNLQCHQLDSTPKLHMFDMYWYVCPPFHGMINISQHSEYSTILFSLFTWWLMSDASWHFQSLLVSVLQCFRVWRFFDVLRSHLVSTFTQSRRVRQDLWEKWHLSLCRLCQSVSV